MVGESERDRAREEGEARQWGGSESGRERVPRDAAGSVRERGGRTAGSGGCKSSGSVSGGRYPAKRGRGARRPRRAGGARGGGRGARTNDEAREPSGPYARAHATRVPGAMARAATLTLE